MNGINALNLFNYNQLFYIVAVPAVLKVGYDFFAGKIADLFSMDLRSACENGNVPRTRELIEKGVDQEDLDHRLFTAIAHGQPEIVKLLLSHGANPNSVNSFGLSPLASHLLGPVNREIVSTLIDNSADLFTPSVDPNQSILFNLFNLGQYDLIRKFVRKTPNHNQIRQAQSNTMEQVWMDGSWDPLIVLIASGRVNEQDANGQTLLHYIFTDPNMAPNEKFDLAKIMIRLSRNADGYIPDNTGVTAQQLAHAIDPVRAIALFPSAAGG